jgi:hypothetical protein
MMIRIKCVMTGYLDDVKVVGVNGNQQLIVVYTKANFASCNAAPLSRCVSAQGSWHTRETAETIIEMKYWSN